MHRLASITLVILIALGGGGLSSQTVDEIEHGRAQLRVGFRSLVVESIPLDLDQADQFMAVYDQFATDFTATNDRLFEAIVRYAENYPDLSADLARELFETGISVERDLLDLRQSYFDRFANAGGAQAALSFFQLLRRFKGEVEAAMFSYIPLPTEPSE